MNDQPARQNAQRAAQFFAQAGLSRLVTKLYEKYIEVGQVGGQIVLQHCTAHERRDIASFLGKALSTNTTVKLRLADIEKALQHSFQCSLPDMLRASFPEREIVTRAEQRAMHAEHQARFHEALAALAAELPEDSRGRCWLKQGPHGLEWLFSRHKNTPGAEQERQLQQVRYVAHLLDQLPKPEAPERLALFAQRTSGDPHMLDADRAAGRLFLLALHDLTKDRADSALSPQDRAQELRLYRDAGLLVDTISSSVAVFNLVGATYRDGTPDQLLQAAGGRVLLLPLRQLLDWRSAAPAQAAIYVVENPQVFEEVIAWPESNSKYPTLICTSGWPSVAALRLLDLLLADSPDHRFYYSGDFDLKGLQIAAYLMARYPGRCHLWHFDVDSYLSALQSDGIHAAANELDLLDTLPSDFAPLAAAMQEKGKWAYQEGIAHLLTDDIGKSDAQISGR